MQKITTFLTFKDQAEEALKFYTSVFRNAKAGPIQRRYGDSGPGPKGSFMTGSFEIAGQTFFVLNAGMDFGFAPGISLFVDCPTQEEVDELWDKLSEGGSVQACGWLTDKFGVSWQIVPSVMSKVLADKDPVKVERVMKVMMQMVKLDGPRLQQAYEAA
ncbi:MAG: VOC family protein [Polaromonas sp.]|uniref:VOC family protein n=1 Tax=Polaromonas sp. TaxID=1869339 RepID=UPI002487998B|nr:VOC family protein [Polaromonas sp.]MDI1236671.1 VOC family protein [Polaromonas sp.]MDI1338431.1 VOC family protein [Polaromonas sp.]